MELDWPADGVAQLKLDMSQNTALEELQDAAWTAMLHSDLVAVVLCGELCSRQMQSIAEVHSSASLSVLMVPLLVVLNGHVGASSAAVTLMCDWRSCTQVALFELFQWFIQRVLECR